MISKIRAYHIVYLERREERRGQTLLCLLDGPVPRESGTSDDDADYCWRHYALEVNLDQTIRPIT